MAILVVDLYKPDLWELLEIQIDQIGDVKVPAIGRTDACEKDMRDAITDFQPAITRKAIVDRDPAK